MQQELSALALAALGQAQPLNALPGGAGALGGRDRVFDRFCLCFLNGDSGEEHNQ